MTETTTRRLLHAAHTVTTVALLVTGLLIEWPDLRARVVGGYGRQLAEIHVWFGWVFAAAPVLALGAAARPLFADLAERLGPPDPLTWRKLHIVITLAASALLTVTGFLLWWSGALPLAVEDASLEIHIWMNWVLAISLPVHLFEARRKIAERARLYLTGESPPIFEFADDPEDEDSSS
jgi:cytochrome b subunit of formate dehydrogenase